MSFNSVVISELSGSNPLYWKVDYSASSSRVKSTGPTSCTEMLTDLEYMSVSDGTQVALDVTQWKDSAGAALALSYAGFGGMPDAQTLGRWIYEEDNYGASTSSSKSKHLDYLNYQRSASQNRARCQGYARLLRAERHR